MRKTINVILHTTNPYVRYGIQELIKGDFPDINIVSTPTSNEEFYESMLTTEFDVIFTDVLDNKNLMYSERNLLSLIHNCFWDKTVVFWGVTPVSLMLYEQSILSSAVILDTRTSFNQLYELFAKISRRESFVDNKWYICRELKKLSRREILIIRSLMQGKSVSQLASVYHISHKTVSVHKRNAMKKLGVRTIGFLFIGNS